MLKTGNPAEVIIDHNIVMNQPSLFPIRVIDVKATIEHKDGGIVFVKPTSWEFHTISHTWSRGIQSWSNDVVNELKKPKQVEATYETVFSSTDFSWHPCYAPLINFLRLLHADGVNQVWLDALCINQEDSSTEKAQEIQRMGSYYAKSLGCYVCAHGFGESFKAYDSGRNVEGVTSKTALPRWFSRVWTFQEFLLPSRLAFIFSLGKSREAVIRKILQREGGVTFEPCACSATCFDAAKNRVPVVRQYLAGASQPNLQPLQSDRFLAPCTNCGGSKSIRLAFKMFDERFNLYFIDRESFLDIWTLEQDEMDDHLQKLNRLNFFLDQQHILMGKKDARLGNGLAGMGKYTDLLVNVDEDNYNQDIPNGEGSQYEGQLQYLDSVNVIGEVSERDCTHDEDRVLSVLGLLGIEGAVQLRLKKSLRQQLLEVAQQMARSRNKRLHTVLVQLCITQFAGSTIPGMSWAPSFKRLQPLGVEVGKMVSGPANFKSKPVGRANLRKARREAAQLQGEAEEWRFQLLRLMVNLKKSVVVEDVRDDGSLVFAKCRVIWDCTFIRGQQIDEFNLRVENRSYTFKAHFTQSCSLLLHRTYLATSVETPSTFATLSVVNLAGPEYNLDGDRDGAQHMNEFKVHVVLLGQIISVGNQTLEVTMICVGDKSERGLRKVGTGWMGGLESIFLETPFCRCSVGGHL